MNTTYPGYSSFLKKQKVERENKTSIAIAILLVVFCFANYLPIGNIVFGGYGLIIVIGISTLVVLSHHPNKIFEHIKLFFPFMIMMGLGFAFNYFVDGMRSEYLLKIYQHYLPFAPIVIGYWILNESNKIAKKIIFFAVSAILILTVITTSIGLIVNEGASRYLATAVSTDSEFNDYLWQNIGGYDFVYSVACILPMLAAFFKQKRVNVFIVAPVLVAVGIMILRAEYATALIIFVVSLVPFFLKRKLTLRFVIIFMLIFVVLFSVFSEDIASGFDRLSETVESKTLSERFSSMAGELRGESADEDSDLNARKNMYEASWETFLQYPVSGRFLNYGGRIGGHSHIIDYLANFGIGGGILLVFAYYKIYRVFYRPFKNEPFFGYMIWCFISVLFLSFVNTGMWLQVLAIFVPLMASYIKTFDKKEEEIPNE